MHHSIDGAGPSTIAKNSPPTLHTQRQRRRVSPYEDCYPIPSTGGRCTVQASEEIIDTSIGWVCQRTEEASDTNHDDRDGCPKRSGLINNEPIDDTQPD